MLLGDDAAEVNIGSPKCNMMNDDRVWMLTEFMEFLMKTQAS